MTPRSSDAVNRESLGPPGEFVLARSWIYRFGAWLFLVALTLCLGATGFVLLVAETSAPVYLPDVLYDAMQLFFLNFDQKKSPLPWQLEIARWMAPALSAYAIYKGLESILRDRFERLKVLLRYHDHVILCGLSRKSLKLATAYRRQNRQVVVIEKDAKHPAIDICRNQGIAVLIGDAASPMALKQAQLARAERLIALGPDLVNLEIALEAERALNESRPPPRAIPCFVHVQDPFVCRSLRDAEAGRYRSLLVREYMNVDEIAGRALVDWQQCPAFPLVADAEHHLVIVGLGPIGEALVIAAARSWNGLRSRKDCRTNLWMTVVDKQAPARLASLLSGFPWLSDLCHMRPHNLDERDPEFDACEFLNSADAPPPTRVYLVTQDEAAAVRAALLVWQHRRAAGASFPIILRTVSRLELARLLPGADHDEPDASINVFSLLDHAWFPELLVPSLELLARAIHERYLVDRLSKGVELRSRPAMRPWQELTDVYKESNRQQAAQLPRTLQLDGRRRYDIVQAHRKGAAPFAFPPDHLNTIARNEHNRFIEERKRTSPNDPDLVPWEELTEDAREITRQQIREWPQLLASVDLTLSLKAS